ncbi:hypothetical protein H8L32_03165 [Undibacterium sp. CY18W]|uniref:Uncharacterized protein n=1 Tax=Undibacterium hunanense TaxID=2762292 RepID=A0ABR6ZKP9_9BURK|nr:hypothetical protein [Undibacterium hunanense]MBC3916475.1 hypothetical protein [Undibacterium hunanense]
MFEIKNISLTLKELGEIGRAGGVAQFRQTETIIATTQLPEFDDYVVNVFAPKNHIFGNFDRYWNLIASEHQYFQPLIKPERIEQTDLMLTKIIHLAGHKKKSNFSRNMMGLWTKRSAFDENSAPSDTSFCDHRHFSILVPQEDLNATFAHFAKQVVVFGDKSFVFMDDEARPGEARRV